MNTVKLKQILLIAIMSLVLFSCKQDSTIVIKMEKVGGVYMVPANVNGLPLKFIFDTGASDVCISMAEAVFMAKNGYLDEGDIEGTSFAQLADGSVTENTRIKIKTIEIGDISIHDISASVAHNIDAPLLLGQSAIKKLGRIEFDGDNLYIHTSRSTVKSDGEKIDEKRQAELDSLLQLAYKEYKSEDYMFAQKHIRDARQVAISSYINNRNWEMDYIDGCCKSMLASTINDVWKSRMPLFKSAFHSNTEKKDGICVEYVDLLNGYASGLAQHYSPDDGSELGDDDMLFEDEFTDVVSLLMERDKRNAYIHSARYYSKNFNVAKSYCEKAIAIDSTKPRGYVELGKIYDYTAGDREHAIEYYNKALMLADANKGYIHRLLAWCYNTHSEEWKNHLKTAATLGDIEAQNALKNYGITW